MRLRGRGRNLRAEPPLLLRRRLQGSGHGRASVAALPALVPARGLLKCRDAAGGIAGRLRGWPRPLRVSEKPETSAVYPGGGSEAGRRLRPPLELEGKQEELG